VNSLGVAIGRNDDLQAGAALERVNGGRAAAGGWVEIDLAGQLVLIG